MPALVYAWYSYTCSEHINPLHKFTLGCPPEYTACTKKQVYSNYRKLISSHLLKWFKKLYWDSQADPNARMKGVVLSKVFVPHTLWNIRESALTVVCKYSFTIQKQSLQWDILFPLIITERIFIETVIVRRVHYSHQKGLSPPDVTVFCKNNCGWLTLPAVRD